MIEIIRRQNRFKKRKLFQHSSSKTAAANAVAAVLALAAYLAFQLVFTTTILRWSKSKL